jgi:hypothetical protein
MSKIQQIQVGTKIFPAGTFKKRKWGILFLENAIPFAYMVANKHGERFFVTCSLQDDGRIRYMFGLADSDKVKLGLADFSYLQERSEAERIWENLNPNEKISHVDFLNSKDQENLC